MQKQTIQRILVYVNSEVAKYQFLVTYFSPLISKNSCARLHVCRDLDSKSNPKKAFSKVCSDIIHKKRKGNSVDACARQGGTCTASSCMKSVEPTLPSLTLLSQMPPSHALCLFFSSFYLSLLGLASSTALSHFIVAWSRTAAGIWGSCLLLPLSYGTLSFAHKLEKDNPALFSRPDKSNENSMWAHSISLRLLLDKDAHLMLVV